MNNNTILAIAFLMAGTLLTSAVTMVPAAYAEGDDDDDRHDGKDRDKDRWSSDDGDGNKLKAEDNSAGSIADCDNNEGNNFDCIPVAVADINVGEDDNGDGDGDGQVTICHNPEGGPANTLTIPENAIETHLGSPGEPNPPGHEGDHLGPCTAEDV